MKKIVLKVAFVAIVALAACCEYTGNEYSGCAHNGLGDCSTTI